MDEYFDVIERKVKDEYEIASKARAKGLDPEDRVDIPLAKDLFERVEGLIGAVKPELIGSGLAQFMRDVEKKYGSGDLRVALKTAEAVASGKFCTFKDEIEAMEIATRVALAYLTQGVVSAPLEGFVELKIKKRKDGKNYLAVYYAGPIRAAGGTAAAMSLLIVDHLRKLFNLEPYDPTEDEIRRYQIEIEDYHERIARLQYYPTKEEIEFIIKHIPIEPNGDPTSQREVIILKNLPRVETPRIRGGMCLVVAEGLAQKAKKIIKKIKKFEPEFKMDNWFWLKELVDLQTQIHAKKKVEETDVKVKPNFVYIEESVAGRPVFAHPMAKGGFRVRYGRSRLSGLAAAGMHPATMRILYDFIATGSQIKLERPGKAAAITPCDEVMGPIVKLKDQSVRWITSEEEAIKIRDDVEEVLFLGDILLAYGEFRRMGHVLVPSPYVREWWIQEIKKHVDEPKEDFESVLKYALDYKVPLHPNYTYFFNDSTVNDLFNLYKYLSENSKYDKNLIIKHDKYIKKILEDIKIPHKLVDEGILIEYPHSVSLLYSLGYLPKKEWDLMRAQEALSGSTKPLEFVNKLSMIKIRDVTGFYVGSRLGRPEKAKMREMTGRPQFLFPVGEQGGRMRSLNEAYNLGFVEAEFPIYQCEKCNRTTIFPICPYCGSKTVQKRVCQKCGALTDKETHCNLPTVWYTKRKINIKPLVDKALERLGIEMPKLVKGVRGATNKKRIIEPIEKGLLRAIHDLYVNKDGTIRFDAIEVPVTHFKPKEIGTSIEKLKELGYTHDVYGKPLESDDQILQLYPQDVILPDSEVGSAADMILKTSQFIDDLLEKFYGLPRYYNYKSTEDIPGTLIIALAPHTSAGTVARVIGFSKTQGFYAHPYLHSACRRNCDGDELGFMLLLDAFLNFSREFLPDKRGSRTMDAPLVLSTRINLKEVDDEVYNMDIVDHYDLDFYEATLRYADPSEVNVKVVEDVLNEKNPTLWFSHDTTNMNTGALVSAYKTLNSVPEKVGLQMHLAEIIRAVDTSDVARIVIEKHFLKDIKGNLRKFSRQEFRCVKCNAKYRRVPLIGKCPKCGGKIVLTVAEGTVSKYLKPSVDLANKYDLPAYLKQTLKILDSSVKSVFGEEEKKQMRLNEFFSK